MSLKKVYALLFLAIHFAKHLIRRVLPLHKQNLSDFFAFYSPDHIFALNSEEKALINRLSPCITCHLCDTACPQLDLGTTPPSHYVTAFSRSLVDYHLLTEKPQCGECAACDAICPEHVPIRQLIEFMSQPHNSPMAHS